MSKKAKKSNVSKSIVKKVQSKKKKGTITITNEPAKIKNVREALMLFQRESIVLARNGKGKSMSGKEYKYVTLDDLIESVRPSLDKFGMGFTQIVDGDQLVTEVFHVESDTSIVSKLSLGKPSAMQDLGGRITYARRYSLTAILGLSAEEDIDAKPVSDDVEKNAGLVAGPGPSAPKAEHVPTPEELALAKKKAKEDFDNFEGKPSEKKTEVNHEKTDKPVQTGDMFKKPERSVAFSKAETAINSAYSASALVRIGEQISASVKLNEEEKAELRVMVDKKVADLK